MTFSLKTLMIIVLVFGGLGGLFVSYVESVRHASRIATCSLTIRQLAISLHNYEFTYGKFPLATVNDPDGKPLHSWRTSIDAFMHYHPTGYNQTAVWDSEFFDEQFQCVECLASNSNFKGVNYFVVVGQETMFPPGKQIGFDDIADGASETIMLVESLSPGIHWVEPRDLNFETMSLKLNDPQGACISSLHGGGAHVAFADGSVAFLTNEVTEAELRALLTIAGGEGVTRAKLESRGILKKK